MILDPWGHIIAEAGDEPTVITAEINPEVLSDTRSRVPVLEDIRLPIPQNVQVIGTR
tara:strand:- start:186 stop:356 length:171 start_codon:yes stop_codon:yes gene_type:complete